MRGMRSLPRPPWSRGVRVHARWVKWLSVDTAAICVLTANQSHERGPHKRRKGSGGCEWLQLQVRLAYVLQTRHGLTVPQQ